MIIDKNYSLNAHDDDDESFCLKIFKKKLQFSVCVNIEKKKFFFQDQILAPSFGYFGAGRKKKKKLSEIKKEFFSEA